MAAAPTVTIFEERPAIAPAFENNPYVPAVAPQGFPADMEEEASSSIDGLTVGLDGPSKIGPAVSSVGARSMLRHGGDEEAGHSVHDGEEDRLLFTGGEIEAAPRSDPNEEYALGMEQLLRPGPVMAQRSSHHHCGDEGAVLEILEELDQMEAQGAALKAAQLQKEFRSAAGAKDFSEAILEEISPVIAAEHVPRVQEILRQTIGWMANTKSKEIDVDYLAWYMQKQAEENRNLLYLTRVTMYMVVFVVMVLLHEDMVGAGLLQRGIAKQIGNTAFEGVDVTAGHKTLFDIDTKEDLWLFLKEVIFPIFIHEGAAGQVIARSELSRVMRYNLLIGGVHVVQRRFRRNHCDKAWPNLGPMKDGVNPMLDQFDCFSTADGDKMTDDCYGPLHHSVRRPTDRERLPSGFCADNSPEGLLLDYEGARRLIIGKSKRSPLSKPSSIKWYTGLRDYDSDTYSVVFGVADGGLAQDLRRLQWLQDHEWIDLQTQYVGIRVFILNPEMSMYTHATIDNFFGHSGEIVSMISMTTFRAEPYQVKVVVLADIAFALFLCYNVLELYVKFCNAAVKGHLSRWVRKTWNWVQIVICHYGLAIMMTWAYLCIRMNAVKEEILQLEEDVCRVNTTRTEEQLFSSDPNLTFDGTLQADDRTYNQCLLDLHETINEFADFLKLYRVMLAIYCIILMLRFFKVFMLQPRLAMVIVTLQKSWEPVCHHLMVFALNLIGFTVAAVLIFGRRNGDFSTVPVAFNTCFRMLFGDFDYENLSKENPITVALWFWAFTWVCAMILLNMFMAIVMDVYTEVKAEAGITQSMWQQMYLVIRLWMNSRTWVSTAVIQRVLKETFQKPFHGRTVCAKIDADMLVQVIPGMHKLQADYFIEGSLALKEAEDEIGMSIVEACTVIADIAVSLQKLINNLQVLVEEMKDELADVKAIQQQSEEPLPVSDSIPESVPHETEAIVLPPPLPRVECSEFAYRADELEMRLQRIADFAEDFTCWQAYRGKEVHERICKIEALLAECGRLVPGKQFQSIADIPRLEEPPLPALLAGSNRGGALETFELTA